MILQMLKDIKDSQSELKHHLTQLIRKVCDSALSSGPAQVDTCEYHDLALHFAQEETNDNPENTSTLVFPRSQFELVIQVSVQLIVTES